MDANLITSGDTGVKGLVWLLWLQESLIDSLISPFIRKVIKQLFNNDEKVSEHEGTVDEKIVPHYSLFTT